MEKVQLSWLDVCRFFIFQRKIQLFETQNIFENISSTLYRTKICTSIEWPKMASDVFSVIAAVNHEHFQT